MLGSLSCQCPRAAWVARAVKRGTGPVKWVLQATKRAIKRRYLTVACLGVISLSRVRVWIRRPRTKKNTYKKQEMYVSFCFGFLKGHAARVYHCLGE